MGFIVAQYAVILNQIEYKNRDEHAQKLRQILKALSKSIDNNLYYNSELLQIKKELLDILEQVKISIERHEN